MKKIAILSESPSLPTGFARTTRHLAEALVVLGHEVVCFGIGSWGNLIKAENYLYEIWPVGEPHDDLKFKFAKFIEIVKPDVILLNYDLLTTNEWIEFIFKQGIKKKLIAHVVIDGLPVYPGYLNALKLCSSIVVPLNCVANYLKKYIENVPIYIQPHLVDNNKFFADEKIKKFKKIAFSENSYIIGVFAQNRPRKQIVQTIQSIKLLRDQGYRCYFLLHTDYLNASWRGGDNLEKIIGYYGLESCVFIKEKNWITDISLEPTALEKFDPTDKVKFMSELNMSQKINCCDAVIVGSSHGGFEYNIIESQACKVPVCSTQDGSIMSEVANETTFPLIPSLYNFKSYGAMAFHITPNTIAEAIKSIIKNKELSESISEKGLLNAKKYFLQENFHIFCELLVSII